MNTCTSAKINSIKMNSCPSDHSKIQTANPNQQEDPQSIYQQTQGQNLLSLAEQYEKVDHGRQKDNSPHSKRRHGASSQIDPLIKRENYAKALRKQMRDNKIQSKRAQNLEAGTPLQLTLLSSNCRGINSAMKQQALADLINNYKVDLLTLQETKLTRRLWVKGFKTQQTQLMRRGGCLCATSHWDSKTIKSLNTTISWLTLVHFGVPVHVFSIYIDPCDAEAAAKTVANVKAIIDSLFRRTRFPRLILTGDFNQQKGTFDIMAKGWGLTEALQDGTQTHNLGGALDQVYTNLSITGVQQIEINAKYSDHTPILCYLTFKKEAKDYNMKADAPVRKQWQLKEAAASKTTADFLIKAQSIIDSDLKNIVERQVKPQKRVRRWYEGVKSSTPTSIIDIAKLCDRTNSTSSWQGSMQQLELLHKEAKWKEFYSLVHKTAKLRIDSPPVRGIIVEDSILLDQESVDEELVKYYSQIFSEAVVVEAPHHFTHRDLFTSEDIIEAMDQTNFRKHRARLVQRLDSGRTP